MRARRRARIGPRIARGEHETIQHVARVWASADTAENAAKALGVSRETIYRWIRQHDALRVAIDKLGGPVP